MSDLNFIHGATVTATDIRKSWTRVLQGVKTSHQPAFVFTNNTPEAVVLSYDTYQAMAAELEEARREKLGRQMLEDLEQIAELEGRPIVKMQADASGTFRPKKKR